MRFTFALPLFVLWYCKYTKPIHIVQVFCEIISYFFTNYFRNTVKLIDYE